MKAILSTALLLPSVLLTGCNTVKGLGEDITGSAAWTQEKMSGGGDSSVKSSDSQYIQNPPQFPKSN
jgi:predicted small secreted protein